MEWQFSAELWPWREDQPGSWVFVSLPPEVADDIRAAGGPAHWFGSLRESVRSAESVDVGDRAEVSIRLLQ